MRIGIIREGKTPPDSRVPLTPEQCAYLANHFPLNLLIQPSPIRSFSDEEYREHGIQLSENLFQCDILMGVKEVQIDDLLPAKTYFFFSHTIKKQDYNRKLLQAVLAKKIRLIDYEVLTDGRGRRLIAFGKFAGMVGAHNALWTYGRRSGKFDLRRMKDCRDYAEARGIYKTLALPPVKIVLTGTGRVGGGAAAVLKDMGIQQVSPDAFLKGTFEKAVFTQLDCDDYAARKDGQAFEMADFFENPSLYKSIFRPFYQQGDILINGIFWDNQAPAFFTKEDMKNPDFRLRVIADVTCDIAPVASIPSTLRPCTLADPVFGYDPQTERETAPFRENAIDMMTIDNLPNELPRDASEAFGQQFIEHILEELFKEKSRILERATVAENGALGKHFDYLKQYVEKTNLEGN